MASMLALIHDLTALAQVVLIDIALAGDNAVVVGLAVAGLPARRSGPPSSSASPARRRSASRLAPSRSSCWQSSACCSPAACCCCGCAGGCSANCGAAPRARAEPAAQDPAQAMMQIVLADLSMSLDNVLAVAGAAYGSTWVLVTGLLLSVVLMGVAANLLAKRAGAPALDRLGRPADRAVRCAEDDLGGLAPGGTRNGLRRWPPSTIALNHRPSRQEGRKRAADLRSVR